jgi:hypothetical protein
MNTFHIGFRLRKFRCFVFISHTTVCRQRWRQMLTHRRNEQLNNIIYTILSFINHLGKLQLFISENIHYLRHNVKSFLSPQFWRGKITHGTDFKWEELSYNVLVTRVQVLVVGRGSWVVVVLSTKYHITVTRLHLRLVNAKFKARMRF